MIGSGAEVMRIVPDGGGLKAVFLPNSELGFIKTNARETGCLVFLW